MLKGRLYENSESSEGILLTQNVKKAMGVALVYWKLKEEGTSRDRPKSAPYPRLKNSKKTSKCRVFSFTVLENQIFFEKITYSNKWTKWRAGPASASPWRAKRGTRPKLSTFLLQLKGDPSEKKQIFEKNVTMPKNWKGDPLGFLNTQSVVKHQRNWRGTLWRKKFWEKSLTMPKKIGRGDPLVSPGMVCYPGKQEKPFWFSSLDQIVQFGAIIFCRTFKNYFRQFVWIEKKATIIVAFHFMKRRLKNRAKRKHQRSELLGLKMSSWKFKQGKTEGRDLWWNEKLSGKKTVSKFWSPRQALNKRPSAWEARMATGGVNKILQKRSDAYILWSVEKKLVYAKAGHIFLQNAPTKNSAGNRSKISTKKMPGESKNDPWSR